MKPQNLLIILLYCTLFMGCQSRLFNQTESGYIAVDGGEVWYQIYGQGNQAPLLLLHGGPGGNSAGFEPLKKLNYKGKIVFFDQLGSGRSSPLTDTSMMTIGHYVEQVETVRKALGLEDFVLYGHSWGTMLGMDYYLKYPDQVKAIVFSSPLFSTDMWISDAEILIATLPDTVQKAIRTHEANEDYGHPDYHEAVKLYYSLYVTLNEKQKSKIDRTDFRSGQEIYEHMWGPSEFTSTGTLRDYDRLDQLDKISVPVLLMAGEFDEARPPTVIYYQSLIPNARFVMIPNAAHSTLNDNKRETLKSVAGFLKEIQ